MSQISERWRSAVLSRADIDSMILFVLILIFCLEPTLRKQLEKNDFRHYYGIFSKNT